eukprot:jgi/Psemu1/30806/gm1.30806_g
MPPSPSPVITPDVAEWIVLQVRHPHSHPLQKQKQTQKQNLANILVSSGLKGLNVRELKLLEKRVYNMDAVKAELSNEKERERKSQHVRRLLPSNAKKAQFVEAVGRAFFRDDACTVYNERLLRDVRDELREARSSGSPGAAAAEFASAQTSSTTTATTTTTTRTAGAAGTQTQTNSHSSRKRPNHQMTQPPTPTQQQQQQQPPDHCMHALLARISEATAAAAQQQQQQQFQYRYNQHQHQHQHRPPSNYDPHGTAWASTATATALQGGGFRLPVQKPLPPQQQRQPFQPQQPQQPLLLPLQLQQQPAAVSGSSSSSSSDPDAQPRTPTEALLLPQLLQMGFARQEILDGIRQLTSQSQSQSDDTASTAASPPASACAAATVTADDLMLHLVSQREAAEEARREDAVRLQSEDSKHEDRERREKHRTAALAKANSWDELSRIFPESWILRRLLQRGGEGKGAATATATATATMEGSVLGVGKRETESRAEFLEILGLEEKSRRWYGWKLPAGYFEKVGSRLLGHYFHSCEDHKNNTNNNNRSNNKNSNNNKKATATATVTTIVAYLRSEKRKLRSGLYELEEQRNGQPKIFLSERLEDNAGTKNEVVVIDDDDDDDEY